MSNNKEQGFTLTELLITLTILAIIITLAISSLYWITKYSADSFYNESKSFIAYVRNKAILTERYVCVEKTTDSQGQYLKEHYLKEQEPTEESTVKTTQILRLQSNQDILRDVSGASNSLICFYPNGFILNGENITPSSASLSDIMTTNTTKYYQVFDYSELDHVKFSITLNNVVDAKSFCLGKGGEFRQCP